VSDSDALKKRLDALNRESLAGNAGTDMESIRRKLRASRQKKSERPKAAIIYRREMPRSAPPVVRHRVPGGPPVALGDAVDGCEVQAPDGGSAYLVLNRLLACGTRGSALCQDFEQVLSHERSHLRPRLCALCGVECLTPGEVLFLDLETTGLAGTPVFLIGAMVWEDGGLVVRQYLARDYSEEAAILSLFLRDLKDRRLLVSFNGKSFDVPYVRVRSVANRVPFQLDQAHFDLLHECRRIWRGRLPDCKLQTLERHVCGRHRAADIPGSQIPDAYHAFVRTGNAIEIAEILKHNMLDLITLAELMVKLPQHR